MIITQTDLKGVKLLHRGKVRDIYEVDDMLLIVATDRISAFDVILPNPVPDKGKILTQISLFWFDMLSDIVPNHIVASDIKDFPQILQPFADQLEGRSMLCKKAAPLPIECIVRGYITGSGWKDYQKTGQVCGIRLPEGLRESDRLPEAIFTPSTKADVGQHDENISFRDASGSIGQDMAEKARDISLALYNRAAEYALNRGVIIADTKFELGIYNNDLILIDEILTPDSSRFWPADSYEPGKSQPSFDKQFVRDYLETLDWDKKAPGPELPEEIIQKTRDRYIEAYERLTGKSFES